MRYTRPANRTDTDTDAPIWRYDWRCRPFADWIGRRRMDDAALAALRFGMGLRSRATRGVPWFMKNYNPPGIRQSRVLLENSNA